MTSTDKAQASHVIYVLEELLSSLNPFNVISNIEQAIRAIAVGPPGDPGALRTMSTAFTDAGRDIGSLGSDVAALGKTKLPEVWSGLAGAKAATVISAEGDLIAQVPAAFAGPAAALSAYADKVESLQDQYHGYRDRLHDALHDVAHSGFLGIDTPIVDPSALSRLVTSAIDLIYGCQRVYRQAILAADEFEGRMADAKGLARAQADARAGSSAGDAVLLADLGVSGGPVSADNEILTPAQAKRVADLRAKLSPQDQAKLDALLANAGSPEEQAYLLKAFAAGHSVADLTAFDAQIHGKDPAWLRQHLSLVDPSVPGALTFNGQPVEQTDETTCGSTSILITRALTDPIYAFNLTTGGDANDPNGDAGFETRLNAEEQRIHGATNTLWPEALGTTPWGATAELNRNADELGTHYDWHIVDDTNAGSVNPALHDAVTAVDDGHPVPVLIGDGYPAHYVVMVGHDGSDLLFYNPSGEVTRVSEQQFLDGDLSALGYQHVQAVITPTA